MIHFVPVLTGKYFEGRYLIKIIVKQGHPSQTYCISRKIMLEGPNRTEELEIVYGYIRHDSRVQELTGFKLIQ